MMKKWFGAGLALLLTVSLAGAWAADCRIPPSAQWMQAVGFLTGDETGSLQLTEQLSRAEAVSLIMRGLGKEKGEDMTAESAGFSDVPTDHWACGYIAAAVADGITDGYQDGTFQPEATVRYEELLKLLVVALGYKQDVAQLPYPDNYIRTAEQLGLTADVKSNPGDLLTRLQAVQIFDNALAVEIKGTEQTMRARFLESVRLDERGISGEGFAVSDSAGGESMIEMPKSAATPIGGGGGGSAAANSGSYTTPIPEEQQIVPEPGQLTAGRWDDHANWEDWMLLMSDHNYFQLKNQWGIPTERYEIRVLTEEGRPAWDVAVVLQDVGGHELWHSRTDCTGTAYVFAETADDNQQENVFLVILETADGQRIEQQVQLSAEHPLELQLPAVDMPDGLDLMFVVDTTGSMGDELQYIKEELKDVVQTIDTTVRLSCNFYRDTTDVYTIRPFPFETDLDTVLEQISQQRAAGGGDYEEAVDLALIDAIDEHDWSGTAKARLLFLVLDAPPHLRQEVVMNMQMITASASQKGVRIIPVASSGVDKNTEILMRSLAIATNGTYLFLTDDSGIGNPHIEPTIGDYQVSYLNDLIRTVIWEYIGQIE